MASTVGGPRVSVDRHVVGIGGGGPDTAGPEPALAGFVEVYVPTQPYQPEGVAQPSGTDGHHPQPGPHAQYKSHIKSSHWITIVGSYCSRIEMTEIDVSDMCQMVKHTNKHKKRTSSSLDHHHHEAAPADGPGPNATHVDTQGPAHAQTHQQEGVPIGDGSTHIRPSSSSKASPKAPKRRAVVALDAEMGSEETTTPDRSLGGFTLEATHAAQPSSVMTRLGSTSKSKMQRHLQLLRRHQVVTDPVQPGVPISAARLLANNNHSEPTGGGLLRRLLFTSRQHNTQSNTEDVDVIREFDNDVAGALLSVGGTFLGLPQEELMASPGMRKLVARNIRWFQSTPDIVKLVGLLAAKKMNQWVTLQQQLRSPDALIAVTGVKRERNQEDELLAVVAQNTTKNKQDDGTIIVAVAADAEDDDGPPAKKPMVTKRLKVKPLSVSPTLLSSSSSVSSSPKDEEVEEAELTTKTEESMEEKEEIVHDNNFKKKKSQKKKIFGPPVPLLFPLSSSSSSSSLLTEQPQKENENNNNQEDIASSSNTIIAHRHHYHDL